MKGFMSEALRLHEIEVRKGADDAVLYERNLLRLGAANWSAFQALNFDITKFFEAAERWRAVIEPVAFPWLVWSMNEDWCYVQQKLVESVGWTPIVGYDPRRGVPSRLTPNARLIDFNAHLRLPVLWMHVPIDFIFAFAKSRMAFWHADLLCDRATMIYLNDTFRALSDGEAAIVNPTSRLGLKRFLLPKQHRYWELAGCFTRGASQHQFDHGCSIWRWFGFHPNCPNKEEFDERNQYFWDSGGGILYWHRRYGRPIRLIPESKLARGHFTRINRPGFKTASPDDERRDGGADLALNFTIEHAMRVVNLDPSLLAS